MEPEQQIKVWFRLKYKIGYLFHLGGIWTNKQCLCECMQTQHTWMCMCATVFKGIFRALEMRHSADWCSGLFTSQNWLFYQMDSLTISRPHSFRCTQTHKGTLTDAHTNMLIYTQGFLGFHPLVFGCTVCKMKEKLWAELVQYSLTSQTGLLCAQLRNFVTKFRQYCNVGIVLH